MINIPSNGGVVLSAEALPAVLYQIIVKIWIWESRIQYNEASLELFCIVTHFGIGNGFKNVRKEYRSHVLKITEEATDSLKLKLYYANKINRPFWLFEEYQDMLKGPS